MCKKKKLKPFPITQNILFLEAFLHDWIPQLSDHKTMAPELLPHPSCGRTPFSSSPPSSSAYRMGLQSESTTVRGDQPLPQS